jgi:hypothetical protein
MADLVRRHRRFSISTLVTLCTIASITLVRAEATGPGAPTVVGLASSPAGGGWEVLSTGTVVPWGGAPNYGSPTTPLNRPIVGIASTPDGHGYWLVASDGGVFTYGDAPFYGSAATMPLHRPIVGIAPTPDGGGYWLVASDGGVMTYGDAFFYGSAATMPLHRPIVGIAATPTGRGYWLVASDGGVMTYGDAGFYGSAGAMRLTSPVVGMAATATGHGYWLVAGDGGIFTYGDAPFYGSAGGTNLPSPVTAMAAPGGDNGYWMLQADGAVMPYGPGSGGISAPPILPVSPVTASAAPPGAIFPNSPFDHPITSAPVEGNSPSLVADWNSQFNQAHGVNYGSLGMPIVVVPANQPLVPLYVSSGCGDFTASTGTAAPIPTGSALSISGDSPLVVYQPSTSTEWEFWQAANSGPGISACWGGQESTTGSGVFQPNYGLAATGISYLATTITEADIQSGAIRHALSVDVARCSGFVAPADRNDCGGGSVIPEGQYFRLPANLPMPGGLTPFEQLVFVALQQYGMVVQDQTQGWGVVINAQNSSGPDPISSSGPTLDGIPWGALQAVAPPG